jgi:hypothetical protein
MGKAGFVFVRVRVRVIVTMGAQEEPQRSAMMPEARHPSPLNSQLFFDCDPDCDCDCDPDPDSDADTDDNSASDFPIWAPAANISP